MSKTNKPDIEIKDEVKIMLYGIISKKERQGLLSLGAEIEAAIKKVKEGKLPEWMISALIPPPPPPVELLVPKIRVTTQWAF